MACSRFLRETDADEIMVNGQIFDHQARLHSFELAMDVKEELLGSASVRGKPYPSWQRYRVDLISEAHQALCRQQNVG